MKFFGSVLFFVISTVKLLSAEAYLLSENIHEQESATVVIYVKGKEVKLPKIQEIKGLPVVDRGGRQSVQTINGELIKEYHYELTFYPKQTMMIPSFEIIVDGQKEYTKPFELSVKENPKKLFHVDVSLSTLEPLEKEIIKVALRFKCDDTLKLQDIKITQPDFFGFWVQGMESVPTYSEGDTVVHGINYYIYAPHSGRLTIPSIQVEATQLVPDTSTEYSNYLKSHRRSFESNAFSLHVKPLPVANKLVGDFSLRMLVDKKELTGNEMLTATLKITGEGNFVDIEPFSVELSEAIVYTNEPRIRTYIKEEKKQWEFMQRFSIGNAKEDFTLPSFSLTFYDTQTHTIKTTQSEPILIRVNNPFVEESLKGGVEEKTDENKKYKKGFYMESISLIIGFLLGVLCVVLMQMLYKKKNRLKLPHFKNDKLLLQTLLSHKGENRQIDALIHALTNNLYHNESNVISKKEVNLVLKSIESHRK